MKLKSIAVDDEPLALKLMEDFIKKVPFIDLIGSFNSPLEAIQFIEDNEVDLLFLDINMPDISGIGMISSIEKPIQAIFCTAYPDFALEGFELKATDYLVKPFSFERFLKACCKAQEHHILKTSYESNSANKQTELDYIFIKSEYSLIKLNIADIIFVEGLKDYIKIYSTHITKPTLTLQSLKSLEDLLPKEKFCRVHKSFIVNLNKIDSIKKNIITIGAREIPIGNEHKDIFQSKIENKIHGK